MRSGSRMKSRLRENTVQAITLVKPFDLNGLNNLTHDRLDIALSHLNSNSRPEKKFKTSTTTLILHFISPYQRLAKLIDTVNQKENMRNGLMVLAELLGGDINVISNPLVLYATHIFLLFKIYGNTYHLKNDNGNSCLHDALSCGPLWRDLTVLLIRNGANVNQENNQYVTALVFAIESEFNIYFANQRDFTRLPLDRLKTLVSDMLVNKPNLFQSLMEILNLYNIFNQYPWWINQSFRRRDIFDTLLHIAARRYNLSNIQTLLRHGANPDSLDSDKKKPIHCAVKEAMYERNDESYSFKERIKIIACLVLGSLNQSLLPNETLSAAKVVEALLTLDLVKPGYREKVCNAIFVINNQQPLAFSQEELLLLLKSELAAISHDEITIVEKISSGTFGKIYKATKVVEIDEQLVAIKRNKHDGLQTMRDEANIHKKLRHPNLVKYFGTLERNDHFGIVMEYADCGNLFDFIHENKLNDITIYQYSFAKQMIAGLGYLHSQGYVHLDFKAPNVLLKSAPVLSGGKGFKLLIADFGTTAREGETRSYDVTTYSYSSPERFNVNNPYRCANDIFGFAIILGEMDTRESPWLNNPKKEYLENALSKGYRPNFNGKQMTPHIATLVQWCWQQLPENRPDCAAIAMHIKQNFKCK